MASPAGASAMAGAAATAVGTVVVAVAAVVRATRPTPERPESRSRPRRLPPSRPRGRSGRRGPTTPRPGRHRVAQASPARARPAATEAREPGTLRRVHDASDPSPPLRLDVIGAGPAYTDRVGATGAAYLVRHSETALCLDLGQGAFPRLASMVEPSRLAAVLISHLHPDHFIDVVALRHYLRWEFTPSRRARVVAPRTLEARLDALLAEPGFASAACDIEVLEAGVRTIGTLSVEAARVTHTSDSYGFRLSRADGAGPGLVYSGDCGRAEDLDPLVRPGDALLSEVSFGPGPTKAGAAHLDGPMVGRLATRTGAGRVLLTHLQMGFDRAATIESVRVAFDGPVDLVSPGDAFDIA